jgi:hypothetical protein
MCTPGKGVLLWREWLVSEMRRGALAAASFFSTQYLKALNNPSCLFRQVNFG